MSPVKGGGRGINMIKKLFSVVLSASILICSGVQVAKADTVGWQDGQRYEYPVTPVDKEWGEFSSHQEMLDHCQLPEECVKEMTTEQLFNTVLKYPLLIDILFYDDVMAGISEVAKQFNGLDELLKREDIQEVLKDKYMAVVIPVAEHQDYSKLSVDDDVRLMSRQTKENIYLDLQERLEIYFEEALFFMDGISSGYSDSEKKAITEEAVSKMEMKAVSPVFNYQKTKGFAEFAYKDDDNARVWKNVIVSDFADADIYSGKEGFPILLSKKSRDKMQRKGDSTIYVKTPNGTKVKCIIKSNNQLNSDRNVEQQKLAYPEATFVAVGYSGNNCHAYAWTGRQDMWMNSPAAYISDKSYKEISGGRPTGNGQKAVWGNLQHSAIVMDYTKQDPIVVSKWGAEYIWRCAAGYCYNAAGNIKYYKRNN